MLVAQDDVRPKKPMKVDGDGCHGAAVNTRDVGSPPGKSQTGEGVLCQPLERVHTSLSNLPHYRAEMLGFSINSEDDCVRYTMFVRGVNNSFSQVDRILSQRLLHGLQRRYGCRMVQDEETALYRGNEVRVATIDGPSKSQICKFRSALPTSLTRYLITGLNLSADVDEVLDT